MKNKILQELMDQQGQYISGEALAEKCKVSRTAIWKHINNLRKLGYIIETANKKGYRLLENNSLLLPAEIQKHLTTKEIGKNIIHFNSIDSTNSYAKGIADKTPSGTLIISEEQLSGRGRLGREWESPKGDGIWMTLILKPKFPPSEGGKLTQIAAASVWQGINKVLGLKSLIKWPNDIVINGKKVCGILTEMSAELNQLHYLIVGIGINVNNEAFHNTIADKATSLFLEKGEKINRRALLCEILNAFELLYDSFVKEGTLKESLNICRNNSAILGKEVIIQQGANQAKAKAVDITEEGLLEVLTEEGKKTEILTGEVSIRGEKGYI
ncbi:biotin--[acetyl-CoA-carboxylase] ligase [Alkaliphilus pronyensis]|uniref:Bifunctional ligase/repressor BirA n=1 Tax=Alkaliphilus pronyensis TaxID=1482732 RepID=A0A6I0F8M9_9FIRM|nr:biotin--[acetyl-CoA-carboxylase] ligase [Alkaliphilus pronyensis]KAB3532394.1 biotin--[acetyl-CoA-carboxylase] ligase [Alkaliphilus pronyensis]